MIHLLAFRNGTRAKTWCGSVVDFVHFTGNNRLTLDFTRATCTDCTNAAEKWEKSVLSA